LPGLQGVVGLGGGVFGERGLGDGAGGFVQALADAQLRGGWGYVVSLLEGARPDSFVLDQRLLLWLVVIKHYGLVLLHLD